MVTLRPRKKREEATPVATTTSSRKNATKNKAVAAKKKMEEKQSRQQQRSSKNNRTTEKDSSPEEQKPTASSSSASKAKSPHGEARRNVDDDDNDFTVLQEFLTTRVNDESKHGDITTLYSVIRKIAPNLPPELQGKSTLAFGGFDYETKSKCTGRWSKIGIMVNKTGLSLMVSGMSTDGKLYLLEKYDKKRIGGKKLSVGKSCIRFTKLEDLNMDVIEEIVMEASNADISPIATTTTK